MTQFQVGRTYWTRSACDHDCVFSFEIIARTAKTVTINNGRDRITKRGISVYDGIEQFKPFGSYSMAAIISADRAA
jgi:hypothetical protein